MMLQGVLALNISHFQSSTVVWQIFFVTLAASIEPIMFIFHCVAIYNKPKASTTSHVTLAKSNLMPPPY
jgi:hypothetical protein